MKPPPAKKEVKKIPVDKGPAEAPPVPPEEIIRRFAARETDFRHAYASASFKQTVRLQEYEEDGEAGGEFLVVHQVTAAPDGVRTSKLVSEIPSTVRRAAVTPDDLDELARYAAFFLTAENVPKYELTYAGTQQVDELNTYAFRVRPRALERRTRYFEGVIWVDDRDFEIVRTFGQFVTDVQPAEHVLFTRFETYRDSVAGKFRFPIYARCDDYIKTKKGEARLRLTIRFEDFKLP